MTHDSIGLGEDGPTHQPIEMLETLRCIPNLNVIRPADRNETKGAYVIAIENTHTPSVLSFSRQNTPCIEGTSYEKVRFGAYVISDLKNNSDSLYPDIILVGTGTELALACQVAQELFSNDKQQYNWIRVVSMPCTSLYDKQSIEYKLSIFPDGSPIMSIEASNTYGWHKYAHAPFGIKNNTFGLSAPGDDLYKHFGFTVSNLVNKAQEVVDFYKGTIPPSIVIVPSIL